MLNMGHFNELHKSSIKYVGAKEGGESFFKEAALLRANGISLFCLHSLSHTHSGSVLNMHTIIVTILCICSLRPTGLFCAVDDRD